MRKWVLFSLLALAIGGASWWHFSRVSSVAADEPQAGALNSPQDWTPEQLRETHGEIVVGGNAPATPSAPALNSPNTKNPTPQPTTTPPQAKSAEKAPAGGEPAKPTEILAKNASAEPRPGEESYTVQKGDTLGAIAKSKYGSAAPRFVDAILKKNSLKNPDALKVGAKLVLPDPASLKK